MTLIPRETEERRPRDVSAQLALFDATSGAGFSPDRPRLGRRDCRRFAKNIAVHLYPRGSRTGDRCVCGELVYGPAGSGETESEQ